MILQWRDKITREFHCPVCGLVLSHSGYRRPSQDLVRNILNDIFKELEKRGVEKANLKIVLRIASIASKELTGSPLMSITTHDLEKFGIKIDGEFAWRKK